MGATTKLDRRYRLYISADFHDVLDPGKEYEVEVTEDGVIHAKPAPKAPTN